MTKEMYPHELYTRITPKAYAAMKHLLRDIRPLIT